MNNMCDPEACLLERQVFVPQADCGRCYGVHDSDMLDYCQGTSLGADQPAVTLLFLYAAYRCITTLFQIKEFYVLVSSNSSHNILQGLLGDSRSFTCARRHS